MYRVLSCLTEQHDYRLVLLAAIICAATSLTSFSIYSRAAQGQGLSKLGWLFLTGLSTGSGIWATHFVAMLSYSAGLPTAYDPLITAVSLLVAVGSTTFGYFVCSQGTRLDAGVGGALIGIGHRPSCTSPACARSSCRVLCSGISRSSLRRSSLE